MNRRWKGAVAAVLTTIVFTIPALGAQVRVDGTVLGEEHAWVEQGVSYMTLRAYSEQTGRSLTWENGAARLRGNGVDLTARPSALYIEVNGRALYVEGGVQVRDGKMVLPLRVLSQACGDGLMWDQTTGTVSLHTVGARPATADYEEEDLYWLARIISAESRGEPLLGQIAVGNVVLNRVKASQFPDSIFEVVFDTQYAVQFEPVANGTVYQEPTQSAILAAKMCLEGANVVGDCLYFFAPALSPGTWIVENRTYHTTIGAHDFYL
ncbi:MAG: cell wall hydrolase [Lawsonibacter sp.]|jgi:N-acetylmuramoyl-L-alanine amidase